MTTISVFDVSGYTDNIFHSVPRALARLTGASNANGEVELDDDNPDTTLAELIRKGLGSSSAKLEALFLMGGPINSLALGDVDLPNLRHLSLDDLGLTSLGTDLARLTSLEHLSVRNNKLTSLQLVQSFTQLNSLTITNNPLREVVDISHLTNLHSLGIDVSQLTELDKSHINFTKLFDLSIYGDSSDVVLPIEAANFSNLNHLYIYSTGLTELPHQLFNLANLRILRVTNNPILSTLSRHIGNLTKLGFLDLDDNALTDLPSEIALLSKLQHLSLKNNKLTRLPPELGLLPETIDLDLEGNPLSQPIPEVLNQGVPELFVYLRSLESADPQYEAKVLLVGEGNVGKTSLVAALKSDPYVKDRATTHGIQVRTLELPHPELDANITLNTWDFGGQEVYRITHQFFFSRRSLYLVVWHAREGQEENAIDSWCGRIRLRVGTDARIIIVATYADVRNPELDYPELRRKFGDMLLGQHAVDNQSGNGIAQLKQSLAVSAAALPQMGELLSRRWRDARDAVLARPEPQISFDEFAEICATRGLSESETSVLSVLLHDLGHVIYYADDDGLRDIVVLQPEWLTKAIGYVLEDTPTRKAGGVLEHARLKDIWGGYRGGEAYSPHFHPYFLRLMEKFDVSYRLGEEENASLIAQLVPYERPALPWEGPVRPEGLRDLTLVCRISEAAPGLISWLTVRNHRFSTHKHWRRGVFLRHEAYASEGILELHGDRNLRLQVRAPSPNYFFSILRDSFEDLIRTRWPGLAYELLIPCPTINADSSQCTGTFKIVSLEKFHVRGDATIACQECMEHLDIGQLLTGFGAPVKEIELVEVAEKVERVLSGVERLEGRAADTANQLRHLLIQIGREVDDCPRLFTIAAVAATGLARLRIWENHYRLTIWCEHPGTWHPLVHAPYELNQASEWFRELAPYISFVLGTLRLLVPIAAASAGLIWSEDELKAAKAEIELTKALVQKLPSKVSEYDPSLNPLGGMQPAEGAGLRVLRQTLLDKDRSRWFGGLRQVASPSGETLWVCPVHYPEYDPGLPTLPQ